MVKSSPGEKVCCTATLAIFFAIALVPIGYMLFVSVWNEGRLSLAAYTTVLREGRQWTLLATSLGIAAGTGLAAMLVGAPVGLALEYMRVPTRRILLFSFAVPLIVPPYISTVAWISLLGRHGAVTAFFDTMFGITSPVINVYSPTGVIFVLSLCYFPLVALTTGLAVHRIDRRIEEAAAIAVSRTRMMFGITVPLVLPGVLAGGALVFLLSLVNFGVPSLLQVNVYPVEIYARFNAFHDFRGATAVAAPLVLAAAALLGGLTFSVRRKRFRLDGMRRQVPEPAATPAHRLAATACWVLVGVSAVLPLAALVHGSLPVSSYGLAWRTAQTEIGQSLAVAVLAATGLTLLGFALSYCGRRCGHISSTVMSVLTFVPFAISGPVLGIGMILLWNRPGFAGAVYGSVAIVVLAVVGRFIFFAEAGIGASLRHIHPNIEEAAAIAGVSWPRRLARIIAPVLCPSLIAAWAVCFVLALQELDVTVLVCPPGVTTLPVRLFTLMHYGPNRLVSALCVLMVGMVLLPAALATGIYLKARRLHRVRG